MAKVKFIFASVLLLVIAFSHAVNSVEGRHLKTKQSNKKKKPIITTPTREKSSHETASRKVGGENGSKTMADVAKEFQPAGAALVDIVDIDEASVNPAVPLDDDSSPSPPPHHMEDFRPTAPGHSPGIGHSVHN
ncbi:precursor of CEP5-like [Telopea speciosissima]|uniref:precursor of CEP5-like n=1 Tax=Telopea speciosissima TaxID=54955 RepID=UPI001CC3D0DB|nr:precursor of CEP5-like [Telopea speciosissima]